MTIFDFHQRALEGYRDFVRSFVQIADPEIRDFVMKNVLSETGEIWPEPLIQLSPGYSLAGTVDELVDEGLLHPETAKIFRRDDGAPFRLYRHQVEALKRAVANKSYVLTSGTGSGKSFAYFIPIIDRIVRNPGIPGPVALIVYPMNALVNSQLEALEKLKRQYEKATQKPFPVRFARYTGQTSEDERRKIRENPPHIILTNYVMGEFLLVRPDDQSIIQPPPSDIPFFLVFDEVHTYRGRQGADVAMLVRRLRSRVKERPVIHIGTSATLVTDRKASPLERRETVAAFASKFFGTHIDADDIIEETLQPATIGGFPSKEELRAAFFNSLPQDFKQFVHHPLVRFIEHTLGIEEEEQGRFRRRRPRTLSEVAQELAKFIDVPLSEAKAKLQETLSQAVTFKVNERPLFAFKLHQFISQTPPLYATLGHTGEREITTEFQSREDKPFYPLYFCRTCGQEYYRVRKDQSRKKFLPAPAFYAGNEGEQSEVGYLAFVEDFDPERDIPDTWRDEKGQIARNRRDRVPTLYYVDSNGKFKHESEVEGGLPGGFKAFYYQPHPFGICLRCGADWLTLGARDSEFKKLTYLGSEGRTSSTTILGIELLDEARAPSSAVRDKLLSFTDNRQDASLQAGHFNDFSRTVLLRAALNQALEHKQALSMDEIGKEVLMHSGLTLKDYAQNQELESGPAAERVKELFAELTRYRLLVDLQRGWRFVQPSLEEVGLLDVGYLAAEDPSFLAEFAELLTQYGVNADPDRAKRVAYEFLDYLRKNLVVHSELLGYEGWKKLADRSRQDLQEFWQIDPDIEAPPQSHVLVLEGIPSKKLGRTLKMSVNSKIGRYFRNLGVEKESYASFAAQLVELFVKYDLLRKVREDAKAYQIPETALIWRRGTGKVRLDPFYYRSRKAPPVNAYFKSLYQKNPKDLVQLEAREHTAQVPPALREEREKRFRRDEENGGFRPLPYLIASPTLELGVDISDLDMVHLRNFPPTPANYAQRVGRAGRQGQPGLVLAFAGAFNHHDRYFFKRPKEMVAGAVRAPLLDLTNESLIRSHIFAEWLAHLGLPLHSSIADVINVRDPELRFHEEVRLQIKRWEEDPELKSALVERIERILQFSLDELHKTSWFTADWIRRTVEQAPKAFDRAFDEWRMLYKRAVEQANKAQELQLYGNKEEQRLAKDLHDEATHQLNLLLQRGVTREEGDFYPYRYLASQEFLPGYNLMALPVRAWVPRGDGEFISRPRALAVYELAPTGTLYHEGQKWTPKRLLLPPGGIEQRATRRMYCKHCGSVYDLNTSVCRTCGSLLDGATGSIWNGVEFIGVSMRRQERITSNEEERFRQKFTIEIGFEAQGGLLKASVQDGPSLVLEYMPAARIHYFNRGPKGKAFYIDISTGEIIKESKVKVEVEEALEKGQQVQRLGLHVAVTQNALRVQVGHAFREISDIDFHYSLAYALKRGMERLFQVEESELGLEVLGEREHLGYLYLEQAEGGLGALRRLVDDPEALARVAKAALEVLHFDPETGEDLEPERCQGACYECLLSYSNQSLFNRLNRHLVKNTLLELTKSSVNIPSTSSRGEADRLTQLEQRAGSELERRFLRALANRQLPLPDEAQYRIQEAHTIADFLYRPNIAVYIDGPHHDSDRQRSIDERQRKALLEVGYIPIVFTLADVEALEQGVEGLPPLKELLEALN